MPTLAIESGKQAGTVFQVTDGMVIGRRLELPFTLDDPKASREHAKITSRGGGWVLVDLKSTNGTFLNGNRVQQARLNHGDKIRIGETDMRFDDAEEEAPEPAPISEEKDQKVDLGLPRPKTLKIDAPVPKKIGVTLKPKRRLPHRKK